MDFEKYDLDTFLTPSRSRPDEVHILDAIDQTCSCPGFQIRKTCQHLDNLNRKNKTMSRHHVVITEENEENGKSVERVNMRFDDLDVNEVVQFLTRKKRKPRTTKPAKTEGGAK